MGKLIIIEGTDASGKQTQTELLYQNLLNQGRKVIKISFPNYESNASYPVKMFLNGEFGNIDDISYYASSSFYAIDRYASYKKEWEKLYNDGYIVISDRYTISNIIHQGNRIKDKDEFNRFCDWILDLEWNKYGIPKPDMVIYLDVPYEISNRLMKDRLNKINGNEKKDILESDENQKIRAYRVAKEIAKKYEFNIINCTENDNLRKLGEISNDILSEVEKIL
ncbi:dTMP kinase [Oceanivirga miroungae]|uniref:Thymidylate kinase n=1 Tax=Oceanivirga miroungae TaxID=1130046 RepID=A0A6I8ME14_9FUSO|nr:thymidylate kinase [Oceanivirga miroungae]VWL85341.1 thymidylate kinase [Oceanivirga miroungae]